MFFFQLPHTTNTQQFDERKQKLESTLKLTSQLFKRLRTVHDKICELILDPNENPEEVNCSKTLIICKRFTFAIIC